MCFVCFVLWSVARVSPFFLSLAFFVAFFFPLNAFIFTAPLQLTVSAQSIASSFLVSSLFGVSWYGLSLEDHRREPVNLNLFCLLLLQTFECCVLHFLSRFVHTLFLQHNSGKGYDLF